jgi:3-phosphoshikimate 1-carboxyvinyltransferase
MGAKVTGQDGDNFAPLNIEGGKLRAIDYTLPMASAQVKSCVLLAGLYAEGETSVTEPGEARDHTERMLEFLGAEIKRGEDSIFLKGNPRLEGRDIDIPGDISSAAYFMVAASITPESEITIRGVGVNSTRTGIIDVLHRMDADLAVINEQIISDEPRADLEVKSAKLKGVILEGNIIPRIIDEIPIIAVAATQAQGDTIIRDAAELRVKESDRIATMTTELRKLGAEVEERPDGMIIHGPTKLKGATCHSHGDHRVAMALAIAGMVAEGQTVIEDTDCIETSFPGFGEILAKIK